MRLSTEVSDRRIFSIPLLVLFFLIFFSVGPITPVSALKIGNSFCIYP